MKNYTDEFESQTKPVNLVFNSNTVEKSAPLVEPSNLYALRFDKLLLTLKDSQQPLRDFSYDNGTPAK